MFLSIEGIGRNENPQLFSSDSFVVGADRDSAVIFVNPYEIANKLYLVSGARRGGFVIDAAGDEQDHKTLSDEFWRQKKIEVEKIDAGLGPFRYPLKALFHVVSFHYQRNVFGFGSISSNTKAVRFWLDSKGVSFFTGILLFRSGSATVFTIALREKICRDENVFSGRFPDIFEKEFYCDPGCTTESERGDDLSLIHGNKWSLSIADNAAKIPASPVYGVRLLSGDFYYSICLFPCFFHFSQLVTENLPLSARDVGKHAGKYQQADWRHNHSEKPGNTWPNVSNSRPNFSEAITYYFLNSRHNTPGMLAYFVCFLSLIALLFALGFLCLSLPASGDASTTQIFCAVGAFLAFGVSIFLMWHGLNLFYFGTWEHSFSQGGDALIPLYIV
jgi:hypothetical protein